MSDQSTDDIDRSCQTCGARPSSTVPVWEDLPMHRVGADPDYIGCTECHTMRSVEPDTDRSKEGDSP